MQINSAQLPELARLWNVPIDTAEEWVRNDGCVNIGAAGWTLRQRINESGRLWEGIENYPHLVLDKGKGFAGKVKAAMKQHGLSDRMDRIAQ
jgi:hypothetical protein